MTSLETRQLLEFAAETRFEDLPAAVVTAARRCVLNHVAVTVGGASSPAVAIALRQVREAGGTPQATIPVYGDRTSLTNAALLHGVMSHVLDFDDTFLPAILHPTSPAMGAALPAAEMRVASGADLLLAYVVAVEVSTRVAVSLFPEHYDRGWHMTGTAGTIGAAVATARLLGLRDDMLLHAVGLAATQAAGHRDHFGTMTKSFHAGRAASSGLLAALLAGDGFTASADPLQGRSGMLAAMTNSSAPQALNAALGTHWNMLAVDIKPYACGVVMHAAIDAILALRNDHGVHADDVTKLELRVNSRVVQLTDVPAPSDGLAAKFSVRHAAAAALIEGASVPLHFTDDYVGRPDVVELRNRIAPIVDPELKEHEAVAVAHLDDGRRVVATISAARGTAANPLPDDQLTAKALRLTAPVLGEERSAELVEIARSVDELPSVEALIAAMLPRRRDAPGGSGRPRSARRRQAQTRPP